jgi:hypothetical protein
VPVGLDVGGFGAGAERDGDFADGAAGVFGVEQGLGGAPNPVAVTVELHRGGCPIRVKVAGGKSVDVQLARSI